MGQLTNGFEAKHVDVTVIKSSSKAVSDLKVKQWPWNHHIKMMSDQFVSCVPSTIRVERMQLIRNLNQVKISDEQLSAANFTEGIHVEIMSEKPFTVNSFWIVNILDLHKEIEKDWRTLREELLENKFLTGMCMHRNSPQTFKESLSNVQCHIEPPQPIDTSSMTETPRNIYPLVIVVACHEEDADSPGSHAAASIQIVHIRDSIVTLRSQVIKQYVKQVDGTILDISPVFSEDTSACFICFEEANPDEQLQLFCLLPCRHSPICSTCLKRIRECPKCRCPIATVFDINAPPATSEFGQQEPDRTSPEIDPTISHLYDDTATASQRSRPTGFIASIKSLFGI